MNNRFQKELELYNGGVELIIGVDEVGRGPLAGPVVASAVVFTKNFYDSQKNNLADLSWWDEIKDSKKLSPKKREVLNELILQNSYSAIGVASVKEIEELNILQASLLAMHRAVEQLLNNFTNKVSKENIILLVDGKHAIKSLDLVQEAIVAGDDSVHSIAAASIVAKVYRDNLMTDLANEFPDYGLENHKGYGTKLHIQAIKKFGLSPIHRVSFCGNIV